MRERPGFDAVVGNPPFMGGKKITTSMGDSYRATLVRAIAKGAKGAADLIAYFVLRANELVRGGGFACLIATDSVADGDSARVGLKALVDSGSVLVSAMPSMPWPGTAGVSVAIVHWSKGPWGGDVRLRGEVVSHINWQLTDSGANDLEAFKLTTDVCQSFAGTYINGDGFLLDPEEAQRLLQADPRNEHVLYPYLTGEDVNTQVGQRSNSMGNRLPDDVGARGSCLQRLLRGS